LQKKKKKSSKISRGTILSVSVVIGVIVLVGVVALNSFSPVNSNNLIFAPSSNIFLKAVSSSNGNYHYQHAKGGKSTGFTDGTSPSISASQGNLMQLHLINEDRNKPNYPSMHNINIDEFNVHTKDLGYFQSESIAFVADKLGTFDYYCTIHPEMKGIITITE